MIEEGQIYTIEGIAASVLILTTTYLVLSSTTILIPGDTHIIDLQLEQIGNDALAIMDTPLEYQSSSPLSSYVFTSNTTDFYSNLTKYLNNRTNQQPNDRLKCHADVYYRSKQNKIEYLSFNGAPYYRENAVKVTRWVNIPGKIDPNGPEDMREEAQVVLLEVLIWRE